MDTFSREEYIALFESLATRNKAIHHNTGATGNKRAAFFRVNQGEEKRQAQGNRIDYPNLNLIPFFIKLSMEGEVNKNYTGGFLIIDKVKDPTIFADIEAAKDNCEQIAMQIIAQLQFMEDQTEENGLPYFDVASVMMQEVGPLNVFEYGLRVQFTFRFRGYDTYSYNPTDFFDNA